LFVIRYRSRMHEKLSTFSVFFHGPYPFLPCDAWRLLLFVRFCSEARAGHGSSPVLFRVNR
jgi:hypothetical protein